MALVVQKFGGTSVADADRIRNVARRVVDTARDGNQVVVIVSAMGQSTDELIELAHRVSDSPAPRELDMLLTAGERISMSLLAMAIKDLGAEAISLTGSQAGILTDSSHGEARITQIRGNRVREHLDQGQIVIVAGFQGVDPDTRDVTTLGRGGSDATAVAMAAALEADVCEIFTDVDGVFTADPRVVPNARLISEIAYDDMLELAASGAGVLMMRSVEFARRFNVPLHVRSSFHEGQGTWVKESVMEEAIVSGVAHDTSEAKITVHGVPDQPGVAARLFGTLAGADINVDMIVQNVSRQGATDISFTVPRIDAEVGLGICEKLVPEFGADGADVDLNVARVSVVGAGMRSNPGIAAGMFRALGEKGINIHMISTSSIRISCVIDDKKVDEAVRTLHDELVPLDDPVEEHA